MDQIQDAFKKCEAELGTPEIVYANAGINSKADQLEDDDFGEFVVDSVDLSRELTIS
jgi:hypothetical protein